MLIYLLKSGACLAIFMAFYTFFLEKENMHVFKRYYLLSALILAFGIPLITFTQYIEVTPLAAVTESFEPTVFYTENVPQIQETNFLPIILWSIYALGVLVFGFLFIKNLAQIIFKIKRNPKQKSKHVVHVLLNDFVTPHTFFKYIFLNKSKFEKQSIPQEVFWHEETHAKQKHSIDVLFIELLQVIFWFNPLIYFTKHAIKMNHEFLADQAVLNKGISLPTYQHILLAFSSNASESPLANAINYSSTRHAAGVIKKRFTVMKTHTTKRKIWLRSLVLLPLLALTLYGFSEKKEVVKFSTIQNASSDKIRDILIYIDENNTISLNGNAVKFDDLGTEINKLHPNLTPQQKQIFLDATIQYVNPDSLGLIKTIGSLLVKCHVMSYATSNVSTLKNAGLSSQILKNKYAGKTIEEANIIYENETINLSPPPLNDSNSPWQVGFEVNEVTFEETDDVQIIVNSKIIEEYNSIAKSINSKPLENRIVKLKDFNRLSEIYGNMSEEQKQVSEPFPSLPKYDIIDNTQQKATPEEVAEYNKLAKQINSQNPNKAIITKKVVDRLTYLYGRMSKEQKAKAEPIPKFPPPPPTPPSIKGETDLDNNIQPPPPPPKEKVVIGYGVINSTGVNEQTQSSAQNSNEPLTVEGYSSKDISVTNNIQDQGKSTELVMINGNKPTNGGLIMTRAELIAAKLSINGGEIVSFKLKIPGKPTQSIKGNAINDETKKMIKESYDKDAIQLFMIKNSDNIEHSPIMIFIKETTPDLKQSSNLKQYLLERDKTINLLKNPAEYPGSFLEMSNGDQKTFQDQYMKMHLTYSKLTKLEKNSAPKILPPAPDPTSYTLKNGKIVKKRQPFYPKKDEKNKL